MKLFTSPLEHLTHRWCPADPYLRRLHLQLFQFSVQIPGIPSLRILAAVAKSELELEPIAERLVGRLEELQTDCLLFTSK